MNGLQEPSEKELEGCPVSLLDHEGTQGLIPSFWATVLKNEVLK